jgi:hypothetical protein
MEDFSFWWYILAAIIYFLTRSKKKPQKQPGSPGQPGQKTKSKPTKSFEELLKEITEGTFGEEDIPEPVEQTPVEIKSRPKKSKDFSKEGEERAFADDESRKVYEDSIKMAEGADIAFERDDDYRSNLFEKYSKDKREERKRNPFAEEIRNGLRDPKSAQKAIIYSEILKRKY